MSPQVVTSRVREVKALTHGKPRCYVCGLPTPPHPPSSLPSPSQRRGSPGAGGSAGLPSEPTAPKRQPGSRCTRSRSWYPSRRQNLGKEKGRALLEPPCPMHAGAPHPPPPTLTHSHISRSGPPICTLSHSPVPRAILFHPHHHLVTMARIPAFQQGHQGSEKSSDSSEGPERKDTNSCPTCHVPGTALSDVPVTSRSPMTGRILSPTLKMRKLRRGQDAVRHTSPRAHSSINFVSPAPACLDPRLREVK